MSVDLRGVFVPCTSPFDSTTGELDVIGLETNLDSYLNHPVRGIVVGGSTGEAVLLDESERCEMLRVTKRKLGAGHLLIAGTGAESTRLTISRCGEAADLGADVVLVQPPAFYRGAMTELALMKHYSEVAEASPIPVIVYQVPLRLSTLEFSEKLVTDLSQIDNIIGIKDSRGDIDIVKDMIATTPQDFQILVGSGAILAPCLELGASGGILAVANLAPGVAAHIYNSFEAGDLTEATRQQTVLSPVHNTVVGSMGVPGVKAGLDVLGLRGGHPRPPLSPLGASGQEKVVQLLQGLGLDSVKSFVR